MLRECFAAAADHKTPPMPLSRKVPGLVFGLSRKCPFELKPKNLADDNALPVGGWWGAMMDNKPPTAAPDPVAAADVSTDNLLMKKHIRCGSSKTQNGSH